MNVYFYCVVISLHTRQTLALKLSCLMKLTTSNIVNSKIMEFKRMGFSFYFMFANI